MEVKKQISLFSLFSEVFLMFCECIMYLYFLILSTATIQAAKPRSVNVALETVLEFNGKDDIDFISTMQNFLKKLKTTIMINKDTNAEAKKYLDKQQGEDNNDPKRLDEGDEDSNNQFMFSNFLTESITVLRSYNDDDLERFFNTLNKEFRTSQTRKEFNEITDKLGFRRLIDRILQILKNSPAAEIRRQLNNISKKLLVYNQKGTNSFVANFLNYFYKKESEAKFLNVLNNLKLYRSSERRNDLLGLKTIIRNGITTIVDPLLKLNPNAIRNINTIFFKYIGRDFLTNQENKFHEHINNEEDKPKISRQKPKHHNLVKENEILDYIEDHKRIIDKHLTTVDFKRKEKVKSVPKRFQRTGTTLKYFHTTRSRKNSKVKTKHDSLGMFKIKPRKNQKDLTSKVIKSTDEIDSAEDRKPVLLKLARSDDSDLKTVEDYLSSTTKRHNRHKKSTRRKEPIKANVYLKTTRKYRKAFKSTTSAEGLSVEHFGSWFRKKYHRKSNNNDTFVQTVLNSTAAYDVNPTRDGLNELSKELTRNNNVSNETRGRIANNRETKNISQSTEENNKDIETVDEKHNILTESIKIKGNIVIENPTEVTTVKEMKITSAKPVNNVTKYRNYNVSIVTKYFNIKPMNPTIIFRGQDIETLNETDVTPRASTALHTDSNIITLTQTRNVSANESEIDKINIKTNEDGLENEIEGIMDKYNATAVPVEFEKLLNEVQVNDGESKKVKDAMQADLAKLLATPTTKSTVTELFTDPFNDIDEATDIF